MKLGAQLFSVRHALKTPQDIRETFHKIKNIGYEIVQLSGAGAIDAKELKDICDETDLSIVCTHTPFDRIIDDTDTVISEHKIFNCPVIGLGAMPKEYKGSKEGLDAFLAKIAPAVKKIQAAGLNFAYHNHDFEFAPLSDSSDIAFDIMLNILPDWHFIMDTYWVEFAGFSATEYIKKIGGSRLKNIHFKDMANNEERSICACGSGTLNFAEIYETCRQVGVENVLVEQDNAAKMPDPFGEMASSFSHLRPIIQ